MLGNIGIETGKTWIFFFLTGKVINWTGTQIRGYFMKIAIFNWPVINRRSCISNQLNEVSTQPRFWYYFLGGIKYITSELKRTQFHTTRIDDKRYSLVVCKPLNRAPWKKMGKLFKAKRTQWSSLHVVLNLVYVYIESQFLRKNRHVTNGNESSQSNSANIRVYNTR